MTDDKNVDGLAHQQAGRRQQAEAELESLFAQARDVPAELPAALTARILADADAVLAVQANDRLNARHRVPVASPAPGLARGGFWAQLLKSIGGAPALAGLAVATMAGVWVGIVPPAGLQSGLQTVMGTTGTEEIFDIYFVDSSDVFEFAQTEG
ncbi:hypothetical protein DL237_08825 [Pseudooceanicola sediminis]|uniref:Dihydroorotate dehydrogenase n=1 Tax=Pseudooceanicola sediminis TaxID=2211117 RepID=A0A399J478_9RHOB|nr:hypothetical protein [Pseudooceanicola sediminis]KAA2316325.1 hypothetical protein E0K93_05675 [Puniceibacterium sp. HSS470]RII39239.1 hypothetical protein DL237_08825 [Pseudooceanicola sediminis]|tara:strand:+ start:32756 stop:33217 length:462 start_codon:yes stop_codon:yes gene_type:complete